MAKPARKEKSLRRSDQTADVGKVAEKFTFLFDLRAEIATDLVVAGTANEGTKTFSGSTDIAKSMLESLDMELERLAWQLVHSTTTELPEIKAKAKVLRQILDCNSEDVCLALARSVANDVCLAF